MDVGHAFALGCASLAGAGASQDWGGPAAVAGRLHLPAVAFLCSCGGARLRLPAGGATPAPGFCLWPSYMCTQ